MFEVLDDTRRESRRSSTLGGKRLSLPVAVGLHAAVIAAFVGASAWYTGETPEPAIRIVYPTTLAGGTVSLPPPRGGEANPAPHGPKTGPQTATVSRVVPRDPGAATVVDPGASAQTSELPGTGDSGEDPGSGTDLIGDHEGGGGDDPLGGGDRVLIPGGDVREPVALERADPDYPEPARRAHQQGTVVLEAIITASGAVQEVRVLKTLNPILDEAAMRAVRQWRYRPATLNGRAVPVYLTVTVKFGLNG